MIRDVGKSANSNWFELARHDKEASESGRKPHRSNKKAVLSQGEPSDAAVNFDTY